MTGSKKLPIIFFVNKDKEKLYKNKCIRQQWKNMNTINLEGQITSRKVVFWVIYSSINQIDILFFIKYSDTLLRIFSQCFLVENWGIILEWIQLSATFWYNLVITFPNILLSCIAKMLILIASISVILECERENVVKNEFVITQLSCRNFPFF